MSAFLNQLSKLLLFSVSALASPSIKGGGNYEKNKETAEKNGINDGCIYDQYAPVFHEMRAGSAAFSKVGCEIIAVYNALRLKGTPEKLEDVIRDFEAHGLIMANGHFGSNPNRIDRYFSMKGIEFKKCSTPRKLTISENDVFIVSSWNARLTSGLHTYAGKRENGSCTMYNHGCAQKKKTACCSHADAGELYHNNGNRFIVGYVLL